MEEYNLDKVLDTFDYCSLGNSLFQNKLVVDDGLTPERKYRNAQLNWHSVACALKEHHYNREKASIDIKRKLIELDIIEEKLQKSKGNKRKLLELDKEEIQIKLQELDATYKLHMPLVNDAITNLKFFQKQMDDLRSQGLRNFEEAELDHHRIRATREAISERVANELGIDKGTMLYADSLGLNLQFLTDPKFIQTYFANMVSIEHTSDKSLGLLPNDT